MKNKIISILSLGIIISLVLSFNAVLAKNKNDISDADESIPEKDVIYDVPGHPNMKVRVFVYNPKEQKRSSPPSPSLVCGLPDPDSSSVVNSTGWHLPSNWTYYLNPDSVPASVGQSNLATISSLSFGNWQNAGNGKVNFARGSNTSVSRKSFDGKNIIAWGRTSGSALGVTYTWYYPSTGLVAETDTILNKKFSWSWSGNNGGCADSNSYDAQDILTHELGHWMGLDDEYTSNFIDNTMYGYGSKGEIKKDTLTTGDITGVSLIYP